MSSSQKPDKKFQLEQIRKENHSLRKILNYTPDLLYIINLKENKVEFINDKIKDILGLDPDFFLGNSQDTFNSLLHPDDARSRIENLEKCANSIKDEDCYAEVRLKVTHKDWQWFKITDKVFEKDAAGIASHILSTVQNIHQQKRLERKQQEEHRRFLNAQEISHIGSFERKLPGQLFYYSPEFYHILGLEPKEEKIGMEEFMSHVHPDDRAEYLTAIEKTHTTGEPLDMITRAIRPSGSLRYIHRRAAIRRDDAGNAIRVYGTAQDITERIEAEQERKRLNNLMQTTEIVAGTGSYEADLRTNQVYFSQGLYRLFGYEPGEFEPSMEWVNAQSHPNDVSIVRQILEEAASTRSGYTYTRRIYRKDGELRILESQGRILLDDQGNPEKFIGLVQDITERKKAEEELQKSEERSRNLLKVLQNAPDSYLVLTTDFYIEMASDAYLEATNTNREDIIGEYLFDIFPDNPALSDATGGKNLRTSLNRVLSTKKPHRMSIQHYDVKSRTGNFEEKHWSPTNTPVLNADGEVDYIIHRVLDITELITEKFDAKDFGNNPEVLKTSLEEIRLQAVQIQKNRALLQSIFDASPNSIILFDILYNEEGKTEDFQYTMLNAFNFEQLDFPYDLVGKRLSREFPMVKKTRVLEELRKTADTGIPADFETQYYGDGLHHYFRFRAKKVENRLVLTTEDITERKKSEETMHQMLHGSFTGISILDSVRNDEGQIIDFIFRGVNKTTAKLSNLKREEMEGKRLINLFPGAKEIFFDMFAEVVETGKPLRLQRYYPYENLNIWMDVSAVKNGDGFIMTFHDITDQKNAEKELLRLKEKLAQRAKDKYRKIINSMDEAFCLLELIYDDNGICIDYRYLETNPMFAEQSGIMNVEGKTIKEFVPDIEPFWMEKYSQVAKTGKSMRFNNYVEGLKRWFDVYAFRMDSRDDQHVAVIFKDITERKEAEERQTFLLELNDALRPLEDPNEIQFTAMQFLGKHLEVNRAFYAEVLEDEDTFLANKGYLNGVSAVPYKTKISDFDSDIRDILKKGRTLVVNNMLEDLEITENKKAIIEATGVQALIGVPLVKNKKLLAIVRIHSSMPRNWSLAEISLVEEVGNMTWAAVERARAETALRLSQERLEKVLTIETVGVLFFDDESNFLDANDAFLNMIGYTKEDFKNQNVKSEDVTLKEWIPRTWEAIEEVKLHGLFSPYEKELIRPDGTRWWGMFAGKKLSEKEYVEFIVDITEAKRIEEDLIKAKEQAEAATIAKEDFVSTMSHEIRTPLNAVIGLTNLLLDKNPREDQKKNLNSLSFSAQNLLSLINDILDFSKLEAGKGEIDNNIFELSGLILSLQQLYEPQAKNNGSSLQVHIDPNIPKRIVTDQLKLSQILHNLVSNAIKFTKNGTIDFRIQISEEKDNTLWLDFVVQDTGIGVPEEKLLHIFEKFSQAESSTVRQYGGTGLGLTITKLLLELLGSDIKVESIEDEGSKFYFTLPVKKGVEENPETMPQNELAEKKIDLGKLNILLVEDVEINRNILHQFFENWWQIHPDEAINGEKAVEMAKEKKYDMLLMDVRMPVMDGTKATKLIREIPGYKDIPILALTADKNQELLQSRNATQFDDLLTKPFDPIQLRKKILHHLKHLQKSNDTNSHKKALNPQSNDDQMPTGKEKDKLTYSITKFENISGGNIELLKKLINSALKGIQTYKQEFIPAAENLDLKALSDLIHKNTNTLYYVEAERLKNLVSDYRENIKITEQSGSNQEEFKDVIAEFDVVIKGLEDYIKEI
ncbi:PAS domain S-box protein [Salegentibacter sp. F188]|uniref:histidine kinase n=1 Tax=Autumnicola patrickiae TaxID=3075591 RepID=A0ABU3E2S1_9FLAO|nr:PAS domain S-box protein [Salegentibacter sp. F188]MDT0690290.1 PAS domain S-box protein [Salegentibacter sp. F188]